MQCFYSAWYANAMRLLGIDYGVKRVGLALSDEEGIMAFPHTVIENNSDLLDTIRTVIEEHNINTVVVGQSQNLEGKANPVQKHIDAFTEELKRTAKCDVVFEPEQFTTQEATRIQGKDRHTDAAAAAIILNSYITRNKETQ